MVGGVAKSAGAYNRRQGKSKLKSVKLGITKLDNNIECEEEQEHPIQLPKGITPSCEAERTESGAPLLLCSVQAD